MASGQPEWMSLGRGVAPKQSWAFATDAPLVDVQFAWESGETLAADVLGGLYRLDRNGRITCVTRGFKNLRALAYCNTGKSGGAILGPDHICRFDRQLHIEWTMELPSEIIALAMDPFGHFLAASLANSQTLVMDDKKKLRTEFPSVRPLHFLRFFLTARHLLGVANYGVLQRQHISGEPIWAETLLNTVGDVALTGNGNLSYLAGFSHGIQVYDGEGHAHASYVVQGSPSRVSTSYDGSAIYVATQESFLYRLNPKGQLLWAAEAPEPLVRLHADPLGHGFVAGFESGRIVRFDWPG